VRSTENSVNDERLPTSRLASGIRVHCLLFTVWAFFSLITPLTAQIQDNSFLIEEAYNQERGVVQHISNLVRPPDGDSWAYTFTQEWPLGGIRHQVSYTLPVRHDVDGTGLGDVGVNYRYQLIGNPAASVVFAPRLSFFLPTGDLEAGRGTGGVSLQTNLPLTLVLLPQVVTHWNAGLTLTPTAKSDTGNEATAASFNLGASAIWLVRPSFNLMVEALWLSVESVGTAGTTRNNAMLLNPGFRAAFDVADLQIVPGLGYTFDVGSSSDEEALFVYLSLEHPFTR
jgi:hypothetical protein